MPRHRAFLIFAGIILLGCAWEAFVAKPPRPVCEACLMNPPKPVSALEP
ncbi:hypothetical protein [Symmachiella macrocystis]|nr:hypothetical protein [Symmachiella macrocystis]